jgi:acyl carrier protein
MTEKDIDRTISQILSRILALEITPGQQIRRKDLDRWDSLKNLEIVFALESALGVTFDEEDIASVEGTDDLKKVCLRNAA